MAKQNIYDDEVFFEHFRTLREDEINFNDVIETPIIISMLPDLKGKKVLDIGCGMGQHARQYAQMGAASVLGTDISEKMLAYAAKHNAADNINYRRLAFEDLDKCVFRILECTLEYLGGTAKAIDPSTRETYEYYCK